MSKELSPIEKRRQDVYKHMTPQLREVADAFFAKIGKLAAGMILTQYDIGARVSEVLSAETTYGTEAVKQLAEYLAIPGGETMLYDARNLAETFEKEYVRSWSMQPMADGSHMCVGHWFALTRVKDAKEREKLLKRVLSESMAVRELQAEVRASGVETKNSRQGGRKPKTPTSPVIGLQRLFEMGQRLNNYEDVADKSTFDAIEHMPPDRVDDNLVEKLEKTIHELEGTKKTAGDMCKRAAECLKRCNSVLKNRKTEDDGADDDDGESEKSSKKKKNEEEAPKKKNGAGKPKRKVVEA